MTAGRGRLVLDKPIGVRCLETLQNFAAYGNNADYPAFAEEDSSHLVDCTDSEDSKSSAMDASEVRLLAQPSGRVAAPIRPLCLAVDLKERLVCVQSERTKRCSCDLGEHWVAVAARGRHVHPLLCLHLSRAAECTGDASVLRLPSRRLLRHGHVLWIS